MTKPRNLNIVRYSSLLAVSTSLAFGCNKPFDCADTVTCAGDGDGDDGMGGDPLGDGDGDVGTGGGDGDGDMGTGGGDGDGDGDEGTGGGDGDGTGGGMGGDPAGDGDGDAPTGGTAATCSEDDLRCSPTANRPQRCDADGNWRNEAPCEFVCTDGFCGGECSPDDIRCDGASGVPQLCDADGIWQNEAACGQDQVCASGECLCVAPLVQCGDECLPSLEDNPDHCGACGHSCQGGECVEGVCQPFELYDGPLGYNAADFVSDETHLYWGSTANNGSISRVPKNGGNMQPLDDQLYQSGVRPSLALGGGALYFSTDTEIIAAAPDASNQVSFVDVSAGAMLLADGRLYFSQFVTGEGTTFYSKEIGSSGAATPVASDPGAAGFTIADGCLFVVSPGPPGRLMRKCGNEEPVERYASQAGLILGVRDAAHDGDLYFIERGVGVRRLAIGTETAPTTVSPSSTSLRYLIVDEDAMYFIDGDPGGAPACTSNWGLYRQAHGDASATPLISAPMDCPAALAQDADSLYWRNHGALGGGRQVMKMAKPLPCGRVISARL